MDKVQLVKELKKAAFRRILQQLNSEEGKLITWNIMDDSGEEYMESKWISCNSLEDGVIYLPGSFHAGINSGVMFYQGMVALANEVAKREVRDFLVRIGFKVNDVTRAWYAKIEK